MDRFLVGIVTAIGGEIAKYTVAPIARQLGYLVYYRRNVDNLSNQLEHLEKKKTIIDRRVEEARRKGEETEEYVETWLSEAEKRSDEAKSILNDEGHRKAECSCGLSSYPHLALRRQLSRRAKKTAETIVEEITKADTFVSISYTPVLQSSFANKSFETFDTRVLTSEEIVEALKDPVLGLIGVYGMGGVGKTTLVKDVARKVRELELFSEVVMVTVTQAFDLKSIQQKIAEKLGFGFYEETISARADRLQHRLRRENKLLVILDDIWEELKLEDAGIYFKDDQKGCKILLISRDQYVLRNLMGVEKDIRVDVLSDKEAMTLFNKYVGDTINEHPDFKGLASAVVEECGGLPIAIETIVCALRKRPICVWEDALQQVKRSPRQGYGKAYATIRTSYDFLGDEEKSILLLCSLHKEDADISVENLTNIYAASCDLFHDMDTVVAVRNRVCTLVDRLKAHCLLLDGNYHDMVKMHDTIRDIVMSIASEDKRMFCFTNITKFEGCLLKEKIKDSTAISLLNRDFTELPKDLRGCPKLELLLIFDKDQHRISPKKYDHRSLLISDECFAEAKELRALCLDSAILESLPSFYALQNLQTLSLRGCTLENIALIGELKNLIVLDLSNCNFKHLPEQMGKLTRLRLLNLTDCVNLTTIEPNVISRLVQLEELYMQGVLISWEGVRGNIRNASLTELKNLPQLRVLYIAIHDPSVIPEGMFSEKLKIYNIVIGIFGKRRPVRIASSRLLRLEKCGTSVLFQHCFQMLIKRSEVLHFDRLQDVKNFAYQLDPDGFPHLKTLLVEYSSGVRYIVDSRGKIQSSGAFQNLDTLTLRELSNLKKISYGNFTTPAFGRLRRIEISDCDNLKNVLSISYARRLEEITVRFCNMMEEIFHHESEDDVHNSMENEAIDDSVIAFPHLRSLKLNGLPNLIQFLKTTSSSTPLDSKNPLFNQKVVFPSLKVMKLSGIMNFSELWQKQLPTTSFMQNIRSLKVHKCDNLMHLLSVAISRSLIQLESLEISYCPVIEELIVINEHGEEKGTSDSILFPKLRYMKLYHLPSLKRFISLLTTTSIDAELNQPFINSKIAFPSLESLIVEECKSVKYLLSYKAARSLSQLKFLTIKACEIMEEVIVTKEPHNETRLEKISFSKLECLQFSSLLNLKRFCSVDCVECPNLLKLDIYNCPMTNSMTLLIKDKEEVERVDLLATLNNKKVLRPNLKLLQISKLSFRNLQKLIILDCNNLDHLFPSNMVGCLSLLKELQIHGCKAMEEVIVFVIKESAEEGRLKTLSFPRLETLTLRNLQKLNKFCEVDCFECPSLLKLEIHDCPELRTFVANSSLTLTGVEPARVEETNMVDEQFSLFNAKDVHLARSLKNLTTLVVINCGRLKTFGTMSSSLSFPNLGDLQVSKCHEMRNLLGSSVAKSLVQLTRFKVSECEQMTEVIASKEYDAESTDLVFSSLKSLVLYRLPSLQSFHSRYSCIQFPHLNKVIVSECPEMKIFSGGNAITPLLDKVIAKIYLKKSTYDPEFARPVEELWDHPVEELWGHPVEELWEGDLNTSIEKLSESNDSHTALNRLFSETEDKSSDNRTTTHRSIQIYNENTASTSK